TCVPELSPLSLHDALPISVLGGPALHHVADEHPLSGQIDRREDLREQLARLPYERPAGLVLHPPGAFPHDHETGRPFVGQAGERSEEHTSELQSLAYLVCR